MDKPNIVVLQETKVTQEKIKDIISRSWPLAECMTLDARGSVGGLGILWDP